MDYLISFLAAVGLISIILHIYWFLQHLKAVRDNRANVKRFYTIGQLIKARCEEMGLSEKEVFTSDINPVKVLGIPVFHEDGEVSWRPYDDAQDSHSE